MSETTEYVAVGREIPFDQNDPFNKIDPASPLKWLESRIHFPNQYGTVVVGHEMLVWAVKEVGKLIEENERLRAQTGGS